MSALKQIRDFKFLQPEDVAAGMQIRTVEQVGPLYHISKDTDIKVFTPTITRRTLEKENKTVSRISTCPTLVGCLMGYQSHDYDFVERYTTKSIDGKRKVPFKGGYSVYNIPYEYCIEPSRSLLPDQNVTNEHWLCTYSPQTREYSSVQIAKFFFQRISHFVVPGEKKAVLEVESYLEVFTDQNFKINDTITVPSGYYKVKLVGLNTAKQVNKVVITVVPVTKAEYTNSKRLVASLLSLEVPNVASAKW